MENLLLLHGALGAASTLAPLKKALAGEYNVYTLDFSGHGGLELPEQGYSIALFAQNVLEYMQEHQLEHVHIFGYSMGGYVALYLAQQHPDRVKSIFTLATKFAWSEETAAKEVKLLNPEKIKEKVPKFATILAERHTPQNWEQVMYKTADMMQQLGKQPSLTPEVLSYIQQPVQVAVGDRDNMVTLEETIQAYRNLPNASLLILPATHHPLETIPVSRLQHEINLFTTSIATSLPA
ncbi:alpha/beta hydrolase [Pontibacter sp. KCTC 32443]|uniref:alpha/beta fold hydrolase n=1 Tax=Pontibacter TaxID=323449 RepID=UPI00164D12BB|nr:MULTISPECIES: alpha/beta hydrolase [Pontibacter]MBC5775704.1 alpha/beta hydrolase [Pontibacter sp. KCTC 32443]